MTMRRNPTLAILGLLVLMMPGCLSGLVDDTDDFQNTPWAMPTDGEWPHLALDERQRGPSTLSWYDGCADLESDLRAALWQQTLVEMDQNSYWHWATPTWGWGGMWMEDDMAVAEMADGAVADAGAAAPNAAQREGSAPSSSGANAGGEDREGTYSETNNQEDGVDEADFLKTDGHHFYMINNGHLVILGVPEYGEVTLVSSLELEGHPTQMLMDGDQLVIISYVNGWSLAEDDPLRAELMAEDGAWRYSSAVKFTVVDITNRSAPEVGRELFIEGSYQTARLVNGTVRAVSHLHTWIPGVVTYPTLPDGYWDLADDWEGRMALWNQSMEELLEENRAVIDALSIDDFAPRVYERAADGTLTAQAAYGEDCSEFAGTLGGVGRGFTSIMTMDLLAENYSHELDHISSAWVNVYASEDTLVLAEPANDWWWYWRNDGFEDRTNIHTFDISTEGETTYLASGSVLGSVQDQFSISEWNGDIRVASTTDAWGRWWMTGDGEWERIEPVNQLTVLRDDGAGELDVIGFVGDIAEGERIWSARFVGDVGYMVTFRNIDPLWTFNLSDPENPTIMGELHIPGVSTYIHPLGDDHLLTIGMGPGNEDGTGLDWSSTRISLFDVSNMSDPTQADVLSLTPAYLDADCTNIRWCGWSWSHSEATYEHKAFTYWAPSEMLAIPLSTYRYQYQIIEIDDRTYQRSGYEYVSTLKLVKVDAANNTLSLHGEVDHSDFYTDGDLSGWWGGDSSVRRSVFMGEYVYAFSGAGVSVTHVETLNTTATLELPGFEMPEPYMYRIYDDVEERESDPETSEGSAPDEG